VIESVNEAVGEAMRSLEDFLRDHGVEDDLIFSTTLALEEVVTNVIKYAYREDLPHEIRLEVRLLPPRIVLRVSDDGDEYDPLQTPPPDLEIPHEEREVGGLGIHILRNITERIDYERSGGQNILTLYLSGTDPE
jgi:anti-sigma regulatory factor (Ser/Thr protein kinase)